MFGVFFWAVMSGACGKQALYGQHTAPSYITNIALFRSAVRVLSSCHGYLVVTVPSALEVSCDPCSLAPVWVCASCVFNTASRLVSTALRHRVLSKASYCAEQW